MGAPPRWLVDEMLGRLARYLRFVGCDTAYVRGLTDEEIVVRARHEGRILLTRDRELSSRCPGALLVPSPYLADQWRSVRAAYPSTPTRLSFDRCTLCNGLLAPAEAEREKDAPPTDRPPRGPLYRCGLCGHVYWDGSHTASIRERIAAWESGTGP